jgi:WXG100 family type VII secretion target
MMVNAASVDQMAVRFGAALSDIRKALADLDVAVDKVDEEWSGEAKVAYLRAHKQWSASIGTMMATFKEATARAKAAGQAFSALDAATAGAWGGRARR